MGGVVAYLLFVAVVSYFTIGLGSHWLMLDVFGVEPKLAGHLATAAFVVATPILGFGPLLLWRGKEMVDVTHGSARFMTDTGVRELATGTGLIVGREDRKSGRLIRYTGEAHLLTIAPTRSGKGVGAVIPNLLTYEGSVLCIDPKGENVRVTARERRRLGPVYVLDPFGVSGEPSAGYNPLGFIDPMSPDGAEDAATLADALVADPAGQVAEAHWNEEAKALLSGLILHVASTEPLQRRTLARLREQLTLPPKEFADLLGAMSRSTAADGLIARAANRQLGKSDREAAGVLSGAQRHTHFLDSSRIARTTATSDFEFATLKARPATLYLVLPPDRLDTYSRWLRLMVTQAISALSRSARRPTAPVLLLLDEFAALGRLEAVERAMGLMAGYGLQLWPILQDIHQLRSVYGARAGTFLSNAGCLQIFNVNDIETAEWVSRLLGETTVWAQSAIADDAGSALPLISPTLAGGAPLYDEHSSKRALLTPDEVRRLPPYLELLFMAGRPPILAQKVRYHEDHEFQGLFAKSK